MSQLWVDELQRLPSTNHRIGVHAPPTPLPQPPQFPAQQLQQLQQRPFDSYLYFGGDYQTPAHGTPQMSFSELGTVPSVPNLTSVPSMPNMPNMSNLPNVLNIPNMASPLAPMQSLQSLQSLQTLQNLQTLMSNGGNGLAFEPYPPTPDSFRTPAGTEFRSVPMTRHPSGSARPPYPPQLPLSAQSTGQTYYYDRFDRWPQTPQRGVSGPMALVF